MTLQQAFRLLLPAAPTYAALQAARERFLKEHPEHHAIGREAYSKLLKTDVFWFCDFDRHISELPDIPLLDTYCRQLAKVRQTGLPYARQGLRLSVLPTESEADTLKELGFKKTKAGWTWTPR